jgi:hypothetical protein
VLFFPLSIVFGVDASLMCSILDFREKRVVCLISSSCLLVRFSLTLTSLPRLVIGFLSIDELVVILAPEGTDGMVAVMSHNYGTI